MAVVSIAPRALYQEVAELLRQRIFNRELKPGSWIDEMRLAQEYGISRTPLREAIKLLATEGLVTMKVRRGAYVTELSEKDLSDVFHMLELLESDAAAVAAKQASQADLQDLQDLHRQLEAVSLSHDEFFSINERFHMRLLRIADNRWRDQMVMDLRKVMKLNRAQSLLKAGRRSESLQEHAELLNALLARDGAQAAKAMRRHMRKGLEAAS